MILISEASYAYGHADVHLARHAIYLSPSCVEDCETNLKNVCVEGYGPCWWNVSWHWYGEGLRNSSTLLLLEAFATVSDVIYQTRETECLSSAEVWTFEWIDQTYADFWYILVVFSSIDRFLDFGQFRQFERHRNSSLIMLLQFAVVFFEI